MAATCARKPEKAVILVGGYGTRLRPLTFSKPKPLVEFVNRPILLHQLEALQRVGVREVVLALSYMPDGFSEFLEQFSKILNITIHCSQETEALGTAGPLALAKKFLRTSDNDDGSFFMMNADVICKFDFEELLAHHSRAGAEATIMGTEVEDPSRFGVMIRDAESGCVRSFVEKPKTYVGNVVNAGIYILNNSVLDMVEPRPMSIEKEVFPVIAARGRLSSWVNHGYWSDVGKPDDFLRGSTLHMAYMRDTTPYALSLGDNLHGNVVVDRTAHVSSTASLGPDVVVGANCVIEDGARVRSSVLLAGSRIKKGAVVTDSIIGWSSTVGSWAHVEGLSVLGEDVHISDEVHIVGCKVLPHKQVKESATTAKIIM